jgi:hypothetical protein
LSTNQTNGVAKHQLQIPNTSIQTLSTTHKTTMSLSQQSRSMLCVLFLIFTITFERCQGFAGQAMPAPTAGRQTSKLMMYLPRQSESQSNDGLKMIPNPTSIGPTIREQQHKKGKQENSPTPYSTNATRSHPSPPLTGSCLPRP